MSVKFVKMHSLGNDFMIIDNIDNQNPWDEKLIPLWADRHRGIGFEQLLAVEKPRNNNMDFYYRIFNADGKEVEQCGNGLRCLAYYLYEKRKTSSILKLASKTGIYTAKVFSQDKIEVEMGAPIFEPKRIPFRVQEQKPCYALPLDEKTVEIYALSMGNPHCIIAVESVEDAPVEKVGKRIGQHEQFPEGVNVSFMERISPQAIKLRVFERGVGETLACGSAACASTVAAMLKDKDMATEISIHLPGGVLQASWQGENSPVILKGPAVWVFEGMI